MPYKEKKLPLWQSILSTVLFFAVVGVVAFVSITYAENNKEEPSTVISDGDVCSISCFDAILWDDSITLSFDIKIDDPHYIIYDLLYSVEDEEYIFEDFIDRDNTAANEKVSVCEDISLDKFGGEPPDSIDFKCHITCFDENDDPIKEYDDYFSFSEIVYKE